MQPGGSSPTERLAAEDVIRMLDLAPHPEGGHYRETFRDRPDGSGRSFGTAIYFLLREGEVSHWHRVDATEIWHWYAGAALALSVTTDEGVARTHTLGSSLAHGERPQVVVPDKVWQSARSLGAWTLAGCTVAPGFEFSGFELAPDDWTPPTA
ncbi:MAG: cupin domain-containing protein [Methyloligellaceae bacterium]